MPNCTPLRYPGGKSLMTSFFKEIIEVNGLRNVVYAEPFAGGAGTAINLLVNNDVERIKINDASIGVYSFWDAIKNDGIRFLDALDEAKVNLKEWQKQRFIFKNSLEPSFELGFATFFLSRTNRSGILHAGPMGGQDIEGQRNANYKIDCRFNKKDLSKRIADIIEVGERLEPSNMDAMDFLKKIGGVNTLVYLDPPYYVQGKGLYMNYYQHKDHVELSEFIRNIDTFKWIMSYDNVPEIRDMYGDLDLYQFNLTYTAQNIKKGSELLTHSSDLRLPEPLEIKRSQSANIPVVSIY